MNFFARHRKFKLAATFSLLLAALILFALLQPNDLAQYKTRLAVHGEELSLTKLLPAYSVAAVKYQQRLSDTAAQLLLAPIYPGEIPMMSETTNGMARAAWMRPTPTTPDRGTWEDFARQIEGSEAALNELGTLLEAPVAGGVYDSVSPLGLKSVFDFVSRRRAAQLLAGGVVSALHHQEFAAAFTNLDRLISLAEFRDKGDLLVGTMIQAAIASLAISATWESLHASGWSDSQLASMQSKWRRLDFVGDFSRTVEMERALAVACYQQFRTNLSGRRQMVSLTGGNGRLADALYENLYLPIWATAWSQGDERHFLETMQPIIEGVRHATTNNSYHRIRAPFAAAMGSFKTNQTALDRFRFPMAATLMPNWEKAVTHLLRYETQRQMLLTVLALKRYELRHGQLPPDLTSLVAEYLPTLPVDHMNGRHLQYRRISDQRFKLWSVGDNEQDENGDGDDLVWFELDTRPADGASVEP